MSMVLGMATVSDATIARLLADPPLVWRVIAPDDPEMYDDARGSAAKPSFVARLFGKKNDPEGGAADLVLAEGEGSTADLDKAWHGIHYLLTGTAWEGSAPLNFLVSGGRPVGDIDVGYGPARAFDADQVREIAAALTPLTREVLAPRFDPAQLRAHNVYPGFRDGWDQPDDRDYLLDHYEDLRAFVLGTAEAGAGLIVYIN